MGLYSHSVGHLVGMERERKEGGGGEGRGERGGGGSLVIVGINMIYALLEMRWEKC